MRNSGAVALRAHRTTISLHFSFLWDNVGEFFRL